MSGAPSTSAARRAAASSAASRGDARRLATAAAAFAVAIGAGATSRADAPPSATSRADTTSRAALPVCDLRLQDPADDSGNPVFAARSREVWGDVGYLGDWNPHHHPSFALGLEYVPLVSATQRWRLGLRLGAAFGYYGDDHHGWFSAQPGLRARGSFWMDDFFDVYLVAKGDAPIALVEGPYFAARPGIGLGVRVVRYVEIEATFDAALAIGRTYTDSDPRVALGFGASLAVDLCLLGGCERASPTTTSRDFTCATYERAAQVCRASASEHADLCQAVTTAMDGTESVPTGREDATEAFLRAVAEHVQSASLEAQLDALKADHRALAQRRDAQADAERVAARAGKTPAEHCSYAPYAAELRAAFGCAPDVPPACTVPPSCAAPRRGGDE